MLLRAKQPKILLALCLVAALCCMLAACNGIDKSIVGINESQPSPPQISSFICVDINPSVEMIVDRNGTVQSASGANTNGRVLLYNEGGIIGAPLNIAINRILSLAESCGYLTEDTSNIGLSVLSDQDAVTYAEVEEYLYSAAQRCDIQINVTDAEEADIVLSNELSVLQAQNPAYKDVSLSRYRLMKRAAEQTSFEETLSMSLQELTDAVQTLWSDISCKLDRAYARAVTEAQFAYESGRIFANDSLYAVYFSNKALNGKFSEAIKYSARSIYAAKYTALHSAHIYLEHCNELVNEFLANPTLNDGESQEIYTALSPYTAQSYGQFEQSIQDQDGKRSLNNLNTYVNTLYRNAAESDKPAVKAVHENIKAKVLDNIDCMSAVNGAWDKLTEIVSSSFALASLNFTALNETVGEILSSVKITTLEMLENSVVLLDRLTKDAYDNMELTLDELDEVDALKDTIADSLEDAAQQCAQIVADCTKAAEDWIKNIKQSRARIND